MKKLAIMLSLFLLVKQADAQYYLNPVKVDNLVSISMPKEYAANNASSQSMLSARGQFGAMLVIKSANPTTAEAVKNPSGLDNVFKDYVKQVRGSLTKGIIINDHDTTIGKLTARSFMLQVDSGQGSQLRHFTLIYTKAASYTFEYLYDDFRKEYAIGEMKAFLSSIHVSPQLTHADQYITVAQPTITLIRVGIVGSILLAIVGTVIFIRRKPALA